MPELKTKPKRKTCAWITRHMPTKDQQKALADAGYDWYYLPIRKARRAEDILAYIKHHLGKDPDLIVAAHPKPVMHFLAQDAPCPVIIAKMTSQSPQRWTGRWQRVIRVVLETEPYQI